MSIERWISSSIDTLTPYSVGDIEKVMEHGRKHIILGKINGHRIMKNHHDLLLKIPMQFYKFYSFMK